MADAAPPTAAPEPNMEILKNKTDTDQLPSPDIDEEKGEKHRPDAAPPTAAPEPNMEILKNMTDTDNQLPSPVSVKINELETLVWWDEENAGVPWDLPKEVCVFDRFIKKLKEAGFVGRLKINVVVGYKNSLTDKVKMKLSKGTNAEIFSIIAANDWNKPKNRKKDQAADRHIEKMIRDWLVLSPKPQNVMLVTGDNKFKDILGSLKKHGHTTLLASREHPLAATKLRKFADYMWYWREFLSLDKKSIRKYDRSAAFVERKRKLAELEKGETSK